MDFKRSPSQENFLLIGAILFCIIGGVVIGIIFGVIGSFIYLSFVFPAIMGFAGGNTVIAATQLSRNRKMYILILMSLLVATVVYGTYQYGRYFGLQLQTSLKMFSGLTPATDEKNLQVAKAIVDSALEDETHRSGVIGYMLYTANKGVSIGRFYSSSSLNLGKYLTWAYWLAEFAIILGITFTVGRKEIYVPVCETCGSHYSKEKHLGGTARSNEEFILRLLKQKDFVEFGKLMEENADLPSVELYVQSCGKCKQGVSRLFVRRASAGARGGIEFADLSEMMLKPEDLGLLLQQLNYLSN